MIFQPGGAGDIIFRTRAWVSISEKEETMVVKVLIKRRFKLENLDQASQILIRARYEAMKMDGYITSETWRDLHDPSRITAVSMWQSPEAWNRWYGSSQRKEFTVELEKIMTAGEKIEPYALGFQQTT
ncbi:MAG: antibiotic biosynthesis monooxygenase [Desulfosarcina sp.]|nr:antibiotic biosynthesis monooxygenase [Desulfobacterales bacterium]